MSREEKLNKIVEMTKEIIILMVDKVIDREIDEVYINTKLMLEVYRELKGVNNEKE